MPFRAGCAALLLLRKALRNMDVVAIDMRTVRAAFTFLMVFTATVTADVAQAEDTYPRVGISWLSIKDDFLKADSLTQLSVADMVVINPNPGSQTFAYIDQINRARAINPDLKVIRYINISELSQDWTGWTDVWNALDNTYVNPNRGGSNTANDGLTRLSDGTLVGQWQTNTNVNILNYVRAHDGSGPAPTDDLDTSAPKKGERPDDYMARKNYAVWMAPLENLLDGVLEDVMPPWPLLKADWNNDGNVSDRFARAPAEVTQRWRDAQIRLRDNMVGPAFDGRNAPMARSSGRAWLANGGAFMGNQSRWANAADIYAFLNNGTPLPLIKEYNGAVNGGLHEALCGLLKSPCGILHDGTTTARGNNVELGLVAYMHAQAHNRPMPGLGYPGTIFQSPATTLHMARFVFGLALLTDGPVSINQTDDHKFYRPWMLDEYVGRDYTKLSRQQLKANSKWLGKALDPAYPKMPRQAGGRVLLREFENGLVLVLLGLAHKDAHLTATEVVRLPPAGSGKQWRRISGGQDSSWNDASLVEGEIRLGTSAANINRNVIVLRRVASGKVPNAPVLRVD